LAKQPESKSEAYVDEIKGKEQVEPWGLPDFLVKPKETQERTESDLVNDQFGFSTVSHQPGFSSRSSNSIQSRNSMANPEAEMLRQLRELETLLNQEAEVKKPENLEISTFGNQPVDQDLIQLEQLMARVEAKPSAPDPEIEQLEQLIDKLLLLQNPELAKPQLGIEEEIIPVQIAESGEETMDESLVQEANGFFGLEEKQFPTATNTGTFRKTISASLASTQEIYPGEAIEIQLEEDLNLESGIIPAGTILFAQTALSGARLQLTVSGILQDQELIPVSLKGYGLDGIPGIELGEVKGSAEWLQQTENSAQGLRINSLGMNWQSQLATSGVEATRSLLRSKSKLKKLEIKSGHPILLIDSSKTKTQNP
jgi:hypothetical protein